MQFIRVFIFAVFIACNLNAVAADKDLGINARLFTTNMPYNEKQFSLLSSMNVQSVRWDAPWKEVETQKGKLVVPRSWDNVVGRLNSMGIGNHIILDYGNKFYDNGDKPLSEDAIAGYLRYVEVMATHFKGKVKYYQIWNEWNGKVGNTTPGYAKDYYVLLKRAYPIIKSIDPDAIVIGGGFSTNGYDSILGIRFNPKNQPTQFEELLKTDAYKYMDMLSLHPYVSYRTGEWWGIHGFKRLVDLLVSKVKATDGFNQLPLAATEVGWSTALSPNGITQDQQKEFLSDAISYMFDKYKFKYVVVFGLLDGNDGLLDTESNFGIYKNDLVTPKNAADIFKK